ncbi:MAG: hypothetical protein H6926_05820 [Chromatiales bacterium]|nr:hypothetical protein [Chromatiales bacterium]
MDQPIPLIQKVICVLWPSFLTASFATIVFFTVFDPLDFLAYSSIDISRLGAYTIGFFLFWLLTGTSCLLTLYFGKPCGIGKPKANHGNAGPDA